MGPKEYLRVLSRQHRPAQPGTAIPGTGAAVSGEQPRLRVLAGGVTGLHQGEAPEWQPLRCCDQGFPPAFPWGRKWSSYRNVQMLHSAATILDLSSQTFLQSLKIMIPVSVLFKLIHGFSLSIYRVTSYIHTHSLSTCYLQEIKSFLRSPIHLKIFQ